MRKVNIERWGSPVAKQLSLNSLPYFIVCDPSGKIVDRGNSSLFSKYQQLIGQLKK